MGHENYATIVAVFAIIILAFVGIVTMSAVLLGSRGQLEGFEDAIIYDQTLAPVTDDNNRVYGDIVRSRLGDLDSNIEYEGAYTKENADKFNKSILETSASGIVYTNSFDQYSQPLALDDAAPVQFIAHVLPDPSKLQDGLNDYTFRSPVEILYSIGEQGIGVMNGLVRTIPSVRERLYKPNMKKEFIEKFTVEKTARMMEWRFNGLLHRDNDKPAIEMANGTKMWYQHGERHRDGDLPAIEMVNEIKEWWKYGKLHRDGDLPAVEWSDGTKKWFQYGNLHRDGDLPAIEYADGSKEWWKHGLLHRDGYLPTVEYANGTKMWYQHGELHRDGDKPALKWADGTKEWWKHGKRHRDGDLPAAEWGQWR